MEEKLVKEKFSVNFRYQPKQVVKVNGLDIIGEIYSVQFDRIGDTTYYVEWVNSHGSVEGRWFDEDRLELVKE